MQYHNFHGPSTMATTECASAANIEIAADRLSVILKADATQPQGITPTALIPRLRELGVTLPPINQIEALVGVDGRICANEDIVLLRGRLPDPEQPAWLELLV